MDCIVYFLRRVMDSSCGQTELDVHLSFSITLCIDETYGFYLIIASCSNHPASLNIGIISFQRDKRDYFDVKAKPFTR